MSNYPPNIDYLDTGIDDRDEDQEYAEDVEEEDFK